MPAEIKKDAIDNLLQVAGITGFEGRFTSLGGGEGNDTFVLEFADTTLILRVAQYSEVDNLQNEARALRLLNLDQVPKLIYFNKSQRLSGKAWILESYIKLPTSLRSGN